MIVAVIIALCVKNSKKTTNKEMKLNFTNGVEKLQNLEVGEYKKLGWLQVQGTNIDLPILDSKSAANYDEINYSYAWSSAYYNANANRQVILGHNIMNVSSDPMMPNKDLVNFEELMAFVYYDFAKDNLYLQYTKDGKDEIYLIYSIGFYSYSDGDVVESIEEDEYIKKVKKNSIYKYDVDVNNNDSIITLKTCTRMFGYGENEEFQIDARKLRKNEKITKYDVKTTKVFDKLGLKKEKEENI